MLRDYFCAFRDSEKVDYVGVEVFEIPSRSAFETLVLNQVLDAVLNLAMYTSCCILIFEQYSCLWLTFLSGCLLLFLQLHYLWLLVLWWQFQRRYAKLQTPPPHSLHKVPISSFIYSSFSPLCPLEYVDNQYCSTITSHRNMIIILCFLYTEIKCAVCDICIWLCVCVSLISLSLSLSVCVCVCVCESVYECKVWATVF